MSCPRLIALPPSAHATLHRNDHLNQIRGSFVPFCINFCISPQLIERRSPSGRSTQVPQVTGCLCKANVQAVWLVSQAGKAHQRREERRRGERRLGRHAAVQKHRSIQVLVVCITLRSQAPWTLGCRPHSLLSMDRVAFPAPALSLIVQRLVQYPRVRTAVVRMFCSLVGRKISHRCRFYLNKCYKTMATSLLPRKNTPTACREAWPTPPHPVLTL